MMKEEKERNRENNHLTEAGRGEQTIDALRREEREEREGQAQKEEETEENTRQQRKPQAKCKKKKIGEAEMTDGYMNSYGKPRQPKATQMNQARTLLYDKTTETWQCLKCEKKYPKQNARSARSHAIAHKKKEDKERTEKETTLTRICSQRNQDEVRLRNLKQYGMNIGERPNRNMKTLSMKTLEPRQQTRKREERKMKIRMMQKEERQK